MKTTQIFLFALIGINLTLKSQSIPVTGDGYHYYGPNSTWNEYLKVGGHERGTNRASIVATNGNLHIDSKNGFGLYLNHYSQGKTLINTQGGDVGIGTTVPGAKLHVNNGNNSYGTILANADESSFSLYAKTLVTQPANVESFRLGLKHGLNENNGYISFYRSTSVSGGFLGLATNGLERIRISKDGNVGIGTTSPDEKLTVKGKIHSEEVKVDLSVPGPDYVFKEGYDLRSLKEVQEHIRENGHLPNIPSAAEMEKNGVELGLMNMKLLEKIEELTLYLIHQNEEIFELRKKVEILENK
ncbi:tail fiber protein [Ulvibacterium marinum]|uniref:Peptidase S74 domain-containing protein n=1 Tax=Ulvibacterium marinum TaxID=2419782 RepID=A0A3B0C9S9_9FLAO|nr:tail fiber protein [Ulvibacterium marinum]RKN82423.1 hypothetical protein D7Z94_00790 [Ulvibacterium marinum]